MSFAIMKHGCTRCLKTTLSKRKDRKVCATYARLTFKRDGIRRDTLASRKFSFTRMKKRREQRTPIPFIYFSNVFIFILATFQRSCAAAYFHSRGRGALHKSTINIFYLYRQYPPPPLPLPLMGEKKRSDTVNISRGNFYSTLPERERERLLNLLLNPRSEPLDP